MSKNPNMPPKAVVLAAAVGGSSFVPLLSTLTPSGLASTFVLNRAQNLLTV